MCVCVCVHPKSKTHKPQNHIPQEPKEMASAISQVKTVHQQFSASSPKIRFFSGPIVSLKVKDQGNSQKGRVLRCGQVSKLRCAKEGSEKKVLMEDEELIGLKKLNEKCKEIGGIVELLECLEREAIMGGDEGREPTDYNRRAQIFDKSSRVFQALKQSSTSAY